MTSTAILQLHQREVFERNVTRAVLAGAGAGAAAYLTQRLQLPVPLALLALIGTTLACVRGDRVDRLLLTGLALVLPALPWLFGVAPAWRVALAGGVAGALIVKSRLTERGEEGHVAAARPGPAHYVATALATGALAVAGTEVAHVLSVHLLALATPAPLTFAASGMVVALFAGVGSLAAHLALASDPVEARCEALVPELSGEFAGQVARALALYRQCGAQLAALPREAAREELARTLSKLTRDAAELASEWSGVEAHVHESAQADLEREIAELRQSAAASRDAVARQQLEGAARSLTEELGRLAELRLKRERVLAKLKSQVALLERARVALIGMRSSHATVRAAEMSAVSRRLAALAHGQADEARLAHEVATATELKAADLARADAEATAAIDRSSPDAPATVSEAAPLVTPSAMEGLGGTQPALAAVSPVAADADSVAVPDEAVRH
jgi:hypothetical protein